MQEKRNIHLSDSQLSEIAALFKALAEPSRLKLVRALMAGSQTVSDLVRLTGLQQGNVSRHLGILVGAQVLKRAQEGNFVRYELADRSLFELCDLMCSRLDEQLKRRLADLRRSE